MPHYATITDLAAYAEGVATPEADSPEEEKLNRIITRAEDQVDGLLRWGGAQLIDAEAGVWRAVDPAALTDTDVLALRWATCAQAEYRLLMGEGFFSQGQHARVSGPDFDTTGRLPYIGPKVWQELARASRDLYRPGGIAYSGRPSDLDEDLWT